MKQLWAVMSQCYHLDHDYYDKIAVICVALTNFHIKQHPLREQDSEMYHSILF